MGTAAIVGGIMAATAATSFAIQERAADKAEDRQDEANRTASASRQIQNARQRRQAIAQARIAQAQNVAAQSEQVQNSSALSGVLSGLSTQLGANIGAQRQQTVAAQNVFDLRQSAQRRLAQGARLSGLVQGIGGAAASGAGSFGGGQAAGAGANAGSLQPTFAAQVPAMNAGRTNFVL